VILNRNHHFVQIGDVPFVVSHKYVKKDGLSGMKIDPVFNVCVLVVRKVVLSCEDDQCERKIIPIKLREQSKKLLMAYGEQLKRSIEGGVCRQKSHVWMIFDRLYQELFLAAK
jgi:hypothetical protein